MDHLHPQEGQEEINYPVSASRYSEQEIPRQLPCLEHLSVR
jgi:hypothetical protein